MTKPHVRCAIYTRKSSEEGLEQSFNSLEAQREACHAFILSQKHEGWAVLTNHYDDGGFSGGTMERPALKQLLSDVHAGKVDDCVDHRLVVNQAEADTVCGIFRNYLRLGCVRKLKTFLEQKQIRSKVRRSNAGHMHGGTPYSRGALYHLLSNRIYIGEVVHRGQSYPGQHRAIVPRKLWDQVTARLQENNQAHRTGKSHAKPSLLTGKLFDSNGVRFTPTHAVKNAKRYRYCTSQTVVQQAGIKPAVTRFPAQQLENLVKSQIHLLLQTPGKCTAGKNSDHPGACLNLHHLAEGGRRCSILPGRLLARHYGLPGELIRSYGGRYRGCSTNSAARSNVS